MILPKHKPQSGLKQAIHGQSDPLEGMSISNAPKILVYFYFHQPITTRITYWILGSNSSDRRVGFARAGRAD